MQKSTKHDLYFDIHSQRHARQIKCFIGKAKLTKLGN